VPSNGMGAYMGLILYLSNERMSAAVDLCRHIFDKKLHFYFESLATHVFVMNVPEKNLPSSKLPPPKAVA
jgi:hypothetical protein